jgi:hypothetical protein
VNGLWQDRGGVGAWSGAAWKASCGICRGVLLAEEGGWHRDEAHLWQ